MGIIKEYYFDNIEIKVHDDYIKNQEEYDDVVKKCIKELILKINTQKD